MLSGRLLQGVSIRNPAFCHRAGARILARFQTLLIKACSGAMSVAQIATRSYACLECGYVGCWAREVDLTGGWRMVDLRLQDRILCDVRDEQTDRVLGARTSCNKPRHPPERAPPSECHDLRANRGEPRRFVASGFVCWRES